jgi:hypothetical protein
MHVLVATRATQRQRKNDFFWCREGEIVTPPLIKCTGAYADDDCGCARSMVGVESLAITTTIK